MVPSENNSQPDSQPLWPPTLRSVAALLRDGLGALAAVLVCWIVRYGSTVVIPEERRQCDERWGRRLDEVEAGCHRDLEHLREDLRQLQLQLAGRKGRE